MTVAQPDFAAALMDPSQAVPAGLTDPAGRPAGRRFDVYRNNVAHSLTEALEVAFPVLNKLLGDEFFRAMAGHFLRLHPPVSPLLMFYGEAMPAFLAGFPPVAHLPYLPDIARLELARRQSYHAVDAPVLAPERLQSLPADRLLSARLILAPAVRLIRSDWPVHGIWRANMEPGAPAPAMQAEDVLIARPGFDPVMSVLPPGGGAFIAALADGGTLGTAHDAAAETPGYDLTAILGVLIGTAALTDLQEQDQ